METQGTLSFTELVLNASLLVQLVMAALVIFSIVSWTIIFSRISLYRIGRAKADDFEERFWSGIDLNNLYQDCMNRPQDLVGLEVIYSAGFKEFVRLVNSGPADQEVVMDGTYRQMKVACSREVELLENNLSTLATIGSISPYVGLFGTVWGIMHAFVSLAAVKNASLAMVAPPIAEALIATAMGLFAAIPAVMFYNRFVSRVEALENRYYNFMDEFSTILNRRLVTIRSQLNRQSYDMHSNNSAPVMNQEPVNSAPEQVNQNHYSAENLTRQVEEVSALNNSGNAVITSESPMPGPRVMSNDGASERSANQQYMHSSPSEQVARMRGNMEESSLQAQALAQSLGQNNRANVQRAAQGMNKAMPRPNMQGQNQGQVQAQNNVSMNDPRFRGVVPPRGRANANVANNNINNKAVANKESAPIYKAGVEFDPPRNNNRYKDTGEPQYITPGAQSKKRANPESANN